MCKKGLEISVNHIAATISEPHCKRSRAENDGKHMDSSKEKGIKREKKKRVAGRGTYHSVGKTCCDADNSNHMMNWIVHSGYLVEKAAYQIIYQIRQSHGQRFHLKDVGGGEDAQKLNKNPVDDIPFLQKYLGVEAHFLSRE